MLILAYFVYLLSLFQKVRIEVQELENQERVGNVFRTYSPAEMQRRPKPIAALQHQLGRENRLLCLEHKTWRRPTVRVVCRFIHALFALPNQTIDQTTTNWEGTD